MTINRKLNLKEKMFVGGVVTVAGVVGLTLLSMTKPSEQYLRGKDFENVKWIPKDNDSDSVDGYFQMENVPHNYQNSYLYEMVVRDYNGNKKSLKGWILLPDLDKDGRVSKYNIPHPREVNTGN